MKNEKIDFDLSVLSLEELIEVYNNISDYLEFLKSSKIETDEKVNEDE